LKKKVDFVSPQMIEGKAKAPEPEDVLHFVLTKFGQSKILKGKKILMTAGPTVEKIDPVRVITNISTGKTGTLLASELVSAGAKVTLVYGPGTAELPKCKVIPVNTVTEMFNAVKKELKKKYDIVILTAAASDYIPKNSKTKINSKNPLTIKLDKAPKIIDFVKKWQKGVFLVGFKAETNISQKELVARSRRKMKESKADLMVGNDIGESKYTDSNYNEVILVNSGNIVKTGKKAKQKIAKIILKNIEKAIN